ncbi:MAG: four helix bundle protein [Bacteroidota bacterium]
MNDFKKLSVWQKAVDFSVNLYQVTDIYPAKEKFGLVSQLNRSCISIASNIAEGAGRTTIKEFNNFLSFALGSSYECETQIIISNKLGFLLNKDFENLIGRISEIQKMIIGLRNANSCT